LSAKKKIENETALKNALNILKQVSESSSTPRNIRKTLKEVTDMLTDTSASIGIRAANAISMLDDISQDPNMPSFARVTIWSGVSELENIRE
tara:strand:+ start:232 stop:507 length:276 start_codon:yes stop_codon:yes gene_type:complete